MDPDSNFYTREHYGETPLMMACWYNHPLIAEHLLNWGAQVDAKTVSNSTALHYACLYNSAECVKVLLAHNSSTGEPVF